MLIGLFMAGVILLIYQLAPSYFYRSIFKDVSEEIANLSTGSKLSVLRSFRGVNGKYHTLDNPNFVLLVTRVLGENSFTKLAALHPRVHAPPLNVSSVLLLNAEKVILDEGVVLRQSATEINVLPFVSFEFKEIRNLISSKSDSIEYYKRSILGANLYGGRLCPTKDEFLTVLMANQECHPMSDKSILEYLIKPHSSFWTLRIFEDFYSLLSPEKYRKNSSLGFNLLKAMTLGKGRVSEDIYVVNFLKINNIINFSVAHNYEIEGDENWLVLNDEVVLPYSIETRKNDDGFYRLRFRMTSELYELLDKAETFTLKLKKKGKSKPTEFTIPMHTFAEPFAELKRLSTK